MQKEIVEYGYKSFTSELKSHFAGGWGLKIDPTQYAFGIMFSKPWKGGRLESKDGFHYSRTLFGAAQKYGFNKELGHRICKIKPLGKIQHSSYESITTAFIIVKEITLEEYQVIVDEEARLSKLRTVRNNLNLGLVKTIQEIFPNSIIGGSTALYLHGISLKRTQIMQSDIDLIVPFYTPMLGFKDKGINIEQSDEEERTSGADFQECLLVNGVKMDVRIDNKCPYEIIKAFGFDFKVVKLEFIMEAKWRYAIGGNKKHLNDCYEISGKNKADLTGDLNFNAYDPEDQLPF